MEYEGFTLSLAQKQALFAGINKRSDRILERFLLACFAIGILLAPVYDTWFVGLSVGALSLAAFFISKHLLPESNIYQYVGSGVLAIFMAQYIYQMHGLFEMHFFAFVGCTLMITYSNWRLQIPLFLLIVLHHASFAYMQFAGVEGVYFTQLPYMDLTTFIIHASLAGLIISICGLWAYHSEQKIIEDGRRALKAEQVLADNLQIAELIKAGDYESQVENQVEDALSSALLEMRDFLKEQKEKEEVEKYASQGVSELSRLLADMQSLTQELGREKYAEKILHLLAKHLSVRQGTFFILQEEAGEPMLQLVAGYAYEKRKFLKNKIPFGEGLIGQVALEKKHIIVQDLPEDYFLISSSLGSAQPKEILAWPLVVDHKLIGVIEFASFHSFTEKHFNFLEEASFRIASSIANAEAQSKTERLLAESQSLKLNLEENNQQLEIQAERLKASEQELREQQESLLDVNTELEAQTRELEVQKKALIKQNEEIELAQAELVSKAEELEASNAYKSEFLANMSHELRTPLNSILILANILAENKSKRLGTKDVEHAQVIHKAGSDLLTLINDILDLSKIEAGKLDLLIESVDLDEVAQDMDLMFRHVAEEKAIELSIEIDQDLAQSFDSDRVRLEQILKNLLSNACKFTDKGGKVSLKMRKASKQISFRNEELTSEADIICFEVEDSGIGIPEEKQAHIFQAFNQADGSTSRKYGGTGLGLSICVQLSQLLGGEIQLESELNKGSSFKLYLPLKQNIERVETNQRKVKRVIHAGVSPTSHPQDTEILIVEDQELQNKAIAQLLDRHNYQFHQAFNGRDTLKVLETHKEIGCIILDYNLPDMSGLEILQEIRKQAEWQALPVIIHTAEDLSLDIQKEIHQYTQTIISKATQSSQRLIDEINLQLGAVQEKAKTTGVEKTLPKQKSSKKLASPETSASSESIAGKTVFLVDDDMRNIFSISAVLESHELEIETALNGKEAVERLNSGFRPDIILMDIMMPEMDGIEAISHIRKVKELASLPIIAITAKAMAEDKQKCLDAGATDYLPKPLDTVLLIEKISQYFQP
ncbi:MAG: response regulator [Bacteroidota bacterium]